MSVPPDSARAALTGLALHLLDVSFEPASAAAGEIFDRVIEHVCEELSRAAATSTPPSCEHASRDLNIPPLEPHRRRREQALLRRAVLAGHHPAVPASLRASEYQVTNVVTELTHCLRDLPPHAVGPVSRAATALAALARACDNYRRSATRLQHACTCPDANLRHQADLAARTERTLVRELRTVAHVTYGRHYTSTSGT